MTTLSFDEIRGAIARLPDAERVRIALWMQEIDGGDLRVAESAPAYDDGRTRQHISVAEYLEFEAASTIKHEYVDGEIFAMAGASPVHNVISLNLAAEFRSRLRGGPCKAFMADVKAHIKANRSEAFYYPDVMVACGDDALHKEAVQAARLIVEVLSPSTARLDRQEKARNYRQLASLEEYVLVAQDRHEVVIQRRTEGWASQLLSGTEAIAEFRSIGLSLSLASIYEGAL